MKTLSLTRARFLHLAQLYDGLEMEEVGGYDTGIWFLLRAWVRRIWIFWSPRNQTSHSNSLLTADNRNCQKNSYGTIFLYELNKGTRQKEDFPMGSESHHHKQIDGRLLRDHSQSKPAIEYIASLAESILKEESVIEQLAQEVMDTAVDDESAELVLERTEFDVSSYGRTTGHEYDLSYFTSLSNFLDQPAEGRNATFESGHGFSAPTVSDTIEELAQNMVYGALRSAAEKAVLNPPPELQDFFRLAVGNMDSYDDFALDEGYEALSWNGCDQNDLMLTVGAMDFRETLTKLRPDAITRLKRDMARRQETNRTAQKAMPHTQNSQSAPVPRAKPRKPSGQQHVTQILSIAGDGHWSRIFPNPQLGARHIEAYLGPTNSGKTYQALQALKSLKPHEHGIYLAPLRLLAIEVCEELRSQGIAVSLITGEERDIDPQARVACSTIEMLDPCQHYAVGVIDEMQMIADTQRGWAWTQALFEMSASRLFVLGSVTSNNCCNIPVINATPTVRNA